MNRRGFFQRTIGALAAVVMPRSAIVAENVNVPHECDSCAIHKATFKFWRSQDGPIRPLTQADTDAFRRRICEVYEECK